LRDEIGDFLEVVWVEAVLGNELVGRGVPAVVVVVVGLLNPKFK